MSIAWGIMEVSSLQTHESHGPVLMHDLGIPFGFLFSLMDYLSLYLQMMMVSHNGSFDSPLT